VYNEQQIQVSIV